MPLWTFIFLPFFTTTLLGDSSHPARTEPSITVEAPAANASEASPEPLMPPSAIIGMSRLSSLAAVATSATAKSVGAPTLRDLRGYADRARADAHPETVDPRELGDDVVDRPPRPDVPRDEVLAEVGDHLGCGPAGRSSCGSERRRRRGSRPPCPAPRTASRPSARSTRPTSGLPWASTLLTCTLEAFTFLTCSTWSSTLRFLWMTPAPPSLAISSAIRHSVTVSIGDETKGSSRVIFLVRLVERCDVPGLDLAPVREQDEVTEGEDVRGVLQFRDKTKWQGRCCPCQSKHSKVL